jgi:pimeloyl-ACP methyl ester carboxylesterase
MGSNLRATTNPRTPQNQELNSGDPAWRPPNGVLGGLSEAKAWSNRDPSQRQRILDGKTLEVDDHGTIVVPGNYFPLAKKEMFNRGWGELHWDSYGELLCELQRNLNSTFTRTRHLGKVTPNDHWELIMKYDRAKWNAVGMPPLTEVELKKFAQYHYPVYACGYNWVLSNEYSADRLKQRVLQIIAFWKEKKFDCNQVILITHSMGGLVARACSKQIPESIVGIVHGVMPALGAPLCYRRIACGTESSAPGKNKLENVAIGKFAEIAGDTPEKTTATMATASGPMELLPNHLYPSPWLFASVKRSSGVIEDIAPLNYENPYDLYRDMQSWYRLINPDLADPASMFSNHKEGGVVSEIYKAIRQAEKFHTTILGTYYHPNSYVYYGADPEQLSFGKFRWITGDEQAEQLKHELQNARAAKHTSNGGRDVEVISNKSHSCRSVHFYPSNQDTPGDGTVSQQSGAGPRGSVRGIFSTLGYDHQGSYKNESMLALTKYLVVRIAQEAR